MKILERFRRRWIARRLRRRLPELEQRIEELKRLEAERAEIRKQLEAAGDWGPDALVFRARGHRSS